MTEQSIGSLRIKRTRILGRQYAPAGFHRRSRGNDQRKVAMNLTLGGTVCGESRLVEYQVNFDTDICLRPLIIIVYPRVPNSQVPNIVGPFESKPWIVSHSEERIFIFLANTDFDNTVKGAQVDSVVINASGV